jgi:hypothetical protein
MNAMIGHSNFTKASEDFLDDIVAELEVPEDRYDAAERSYKSLGDWLHRSDSTVREFGPQVYVQGSFRLGTVIKPLTNDAEYDIDSVCELTKLSKDRLSQAELKRRLGQEVESYRRSKNMIKPKREGRRCWTLYYADGAQFHMDIVPALPNAEGQRKLFEAKGFDLSFTSTAIAITDNENVSYGMISDDWPRSNPKGYCEWFKVRMAAAFQKKRHQIAEKMQASVEEIPDYKVRTPLQSAIMLLKRHRDVMYADRCDIAPISIIITTLSAEAYGGEETIATALKIILTKMDQYIARDGDTYVIPNPTDPLENFADKWADHPERAEAFFEWLDKARDDFAQLATLTDREQMELSMEGAVGSDVAKRARQRRVPAAPAVLTKGLINEAARQNPDAVNLKGGGRNA